MLDVDHVLNFPMNLQRRILGCLTHENVYMSLIKREDRASMLDAGWTFLFLHSIYFLSFLFERVSKKRTLEFLKIFFITNESFGSAFTCLQVFSCFQSRPYEMQVDKVAGTTLPVEMRLQSCPG